MNAMNDDLKTKNKESLRRLESSYSKQKAGFTARLRAAGRSLEEAEDIIHDLYEEMVRYMPVIGSIRNLSAWMNTMFKRRMIDDWRKRETRKTAGEIDIAEDTLCEIIAGSGLDPLDSYIRESILDALNTAIKALPKKQREVIEAQVFGGVCFREMAERSGENIDTLKARKRYAVSNLSKALAHWIDS